jgi:hypothetical protein
LLSIRSTQKKRDPSRVENPKNKSDLVSQGTDYLRVNRKELGICAGAGFGRDGDVLGVRLGCQGKAERVAS